MNIFEQLFSNKMFTAPLSAWLIAQIIKTVTYICVHRRFDLRRMFGDGGMPSGHSATVISLTTVSAILYGVGSSTFAICAVLAIIVMNDAMGVRRETGIHAERINEIFEKLFSKDFSDEEKLKVLVGHTPLQVFVGALLGLTVGLIVGLAF